MEKVNLYINSKNRDNNDNINHINISLPNGLITCNMDEYFILNVNSFYTCANSGDHCALNFLSVTETVTDSKSKETSPISSSNSKFLYAL